MNRYINAVGYLAELLMRSEPGLTLERALMCALRVLDPARWKAAA